eukprot:3885393-Rhodomonas_salina.1
MITCGAWTLVLRRWSPAAKSPQRRSPEVGRCELMSQTREAHRERLGLGEQESCGVERRDP